MTDKFTDEQIIKALECCKTGNCISCPKWKNEYISGECNDILHFALDLINRQKAELADEITKKNILAECVERQDRVIEMLHAEIDELKEKRKTDNELLNKRVIESVNAVSKAHLRYTDKLENALDEKVKELKNTKTEAVTEFAERLKEKNLLFGDRDVSVISATNVDELVKEMTEGSK